MPRLSTIHPGDILKTEFLDPLGLTAYRLARELHVTAPRVNDIVLQRRGISADMALRLSRFFGNTAQFWLNLQVEYDRRIALNALPAREIASITPFVGIQSMRLKTDQAPAKRTGRKQAASA